MPVSSLQLVIPGLLGPWSRHQRDAARSALDLPSLSRLLGRAEQQTVSERGFEATMLKLFGVERAVGGDLPVAPLSRLADGGKADKFWWLRADPVHLHADLHQVLLYDARMLHLTDAEADDLVRDFNCHLQHDGWCLETPHPTRWYLRLDNDPGISTVPLAEVIGRDINPHLPRGETKESWHALLTEIQMLFHASDVSREREWDNQLTVNSVWFWGGGFLPPAAHSPARTVYARDPLCRGLALHAGAELQSLPASAGEWRDQAPAEHSALVVHETIRYYTVNDDVFRWCDRMRWMESNWFAPCLQLLQTGAIDELQLYPCDGRTFSVSRRGLKRFWRSASSLDRFFNTPHSVENSTQSSPSQT